MPVDAQQFGDFVRSRSRELLRTAWLLTGDWAAAEDLVQESLLHCWPKWDSISSPDAYVRRAMLHGHLSRRRRRSSGEVVGVVVDQAAVDEIEGSDVRGSVRAALALLSPRERAVVVLRYYLDRSESDTAAELGISRGSVKRYASDALAKLRTAPSLDGLLEERVTE